MVKVYVYGDKNRAGKQIVYVVSGKTQSDAVEKADKYYYYKHGKKRNYGWTIIKPKSFSFPEGLVFKKIPKSFNPNKVKIPRDMVDDILDYESGNMTPSEEDKFFRKNKKTLKRLQGHYGRELDRRGML